MKVMESRGRARGHDEIFIMGSHRNQEDGVVLAPDQAGRCHGPKSLTELDNPPVWKGICLAQYGLAKPSKYHGASRIDMSLG